MTLKEPLIKAFASLRCFSRLVGATIVGLPLLAQAQSPSWTGGGTGNWFAPGNWSTNNAPSGMDDISITEPGAVIEIATGEAAEALSLTLDGKYTPDGDDPVILNVTSGSLTVGSRLTLGSTSGPLYYDGGFLEVSGSSSSVSGLSGASLVLGDNGVGEVLIHNSATVSFDTVVLGAQSNGYGGIYLNGVEGNRGVLEAGHIEQGSSTNVRLYIDGGILRAKGNESDFLRNFTPGYLDLRAGGAFIDTNGFDVGITSSVLLYGGGALTKIGEGTLTLSGTGNYTGGTIVKEGTLTVEGGNFYSDYGVLRVGDAAGDEATFRLEAGGKFKSDQTIIGNAAGAHGSAVVTGTGALLLSGYLTSTPGTLTVGYSGSGALLVSNGGVSQSKTTTIGLEAGSEGSITVTGVHAEGSVASLLEAGQNPDSKITIGQRGSGTLTLEEGGIARVRNGVGTLYIGTEAGSRGILNIGAYDLGHATKAGKLEASTVVFGTGSGTINFNQTDTTTFAAYISGKGSVIQRGTGTTILSGNNTHTGGTFVRAGNLIVDGYLTGEVTVEGGTLGGKGVFGSIKLSGGMLAPGNSPGRLRANSLAWGDGVIAFDLGADDASSDFLELGELIATSDLLRFTFVDNGWVEGKTYSLLSFTSGTVELDHFGFTNGGGFNGEFLYNGDVLQFTLLSVIPEPSTYALGLIALAILFGHRSGRRKTPRTSLTN